MTGKISVERATTDGSWPQSSGFGLQANLLARGLRNRSGKLIGLMVPEILHETFGIFISLVEEACVERASR